jgi:cytochrome c peroxidase
VKNLISNLDTGRVMQVILIGVLVGVLPLGLARSDASRSNHVSALYPLEKPVGLDPKKIDLGRKLFNDPRLSKSGTIACATCHNLASGGVDHLKFSRGIDGQLADTNAPTVLNSGLNFRQFWNGRAASLEEQAAGPILNPKEMGSSWDSVVKVLRADPEYETAFHSIYGASGDSRAVVDSIAEFERSLVTLDAPLDRYLRGETSALNAHQVAGLEKFERLGCISCHQGKGVGGNMFQRVGVAEDYFKIRGGKYPSDDGRFALTGKEEDRHIFKVPSLRNIELTAPYFHDGSAATLPDAVRTMARVQLGRKLTSRDVDDIVAFLKALTGKTPETAFPSSPDRVPAHDH